MRSTSIALVALLSLGTIAAHDADIAADPCYDATADAIVYPEQQVFFHEGDSKVNTLADRGLQAPAPWDTTPPDASVSSGAGAGALGTLGALASADDPDPASGAVFAGTFDGCLDSIALELYHASPTNRTGTSGSLEPTSLVVGLTLVVDGETLILNQQIEAETVPNPGGSATERSRLEVGNLDSTVRLFQLDPADEHEIELRVTGWFVNTNNVVFVWDTTEVPAGMVFNGTFPADDEA